MPVVAAAALALHGCGEARQTDEADAAPRSVESSGKVGTALDEVPPAVLEAAMAARPDLDIREAEYETRDGREYFDVGGELPDGSEIELDMMLDGNRWRVVEVQRDIEYGAVPGTVQQELEANVAGWAPTRIIESDQGDGVVIYEFFGLDRDGDEIKHEVRLEDGEADFLMEEWAH